MKIIKVWFILLFVILSSCKDKNNEYTDLIPNVPVNFYLQPDGIDFIAAGSWRVYENEGYRGILVYRIDQNEFHAYERTCPFDPQIETAIVEVNNSGILMVDSTCMSLYNILDGSPSGGPAVLPLKQYFTEFDGNQLHIYNSY
jgi:hypothetical protein